MTKPTENAAPEKPKTVEELYEEARQLSPEERELLAAMLTQGATSGFASPEIETAWMDEVRRRRRVHAEGKAKDVPAEEVLAALQQKYAG